ncbi:TolC family protein [Opacimonas viscosa]|uniref:TolC family protein n=1 Tax=Opacimonas viscosa TaxID=2961944 RepID=A0AA41WZU7_9ALTE|nr:TolC family protein [Opacimonas viscosa]MCP3429544.1 TolC family protein [Opacimonas viscosa]
MGLLHIFRTRVSSFNMSRYSTKPAGRGELVTRSIMVVLASLFFNFTSAMSHANERTVLNLDTAINMALTQDDWLVKSQFEQQRLLALSEGASALPDPTLSIGILNLPTDGFAFDQEPMTQLKVGASQMFPRGDTLALQEAQLQQAANIQPFKRADRRQKVALQTTLLWLDAYQNQASYALVKEAEPLFDKLGDIVSAGYASSVGKANQQDIIRAELELVRLQDRLISLSTQQHSALSKLMQFLRSPDQGATYSGLASDFEAVGELPSEQQLFPKQKRALLTREEDNDHHLYSTLANHPLIVAIDQQISAERIGIDIAEQNFKPQFGVNASYALRDDTPAGNSRADFFSVGMSVSLPLFSSARQDAQVSSSIQLVEATKTEKRLVLRELMAGLKSSIDQYQGASKRLSIYQSQILPQMSQQSDAALKAYTNDLGDFAEVVRAKIAELDTQITVLNIEIAKCKALASIHYYLSDYHLDAERQSQSNQGNGRINND